jgi:hypothetical protein
VKRLGNKTSLRGPARGGPRHHSCYFGAGFVVWLESVFPPSFAELPGQAEAVMEPRASRKAKRGTKRFMDMAPLGGRNATLGNTGRIDKTSAARSGQWPIIAGVIACLAADIQ